MALPFLKNKNQSVAGILIQRRNTDDGSVKTELPGEDKDAGLRQCSKDLIKAVQAGDDDGVAKAIRAAFEILESEPHEENGEHVESNGENS